MHSSISFLSIFLKGKEDIYFSMREKKKMRHKRLLNRYFFVSYVHSLRKVIFRSSVKRLSVSYHVPFESIHYTFHSKLSKVQFNSIANIDNDDKYSHSERQPDSSVQK